VIRIITETGLRVYKELMPMKKEQVDLENAVAWIPDSKTPDGVAEVPLRRWLSRLFVIRFEFLVPVRGCFQMRRVRLDTRRV
jgi:hypothetical protein